MPDNSYLIFGVLVAIQITLIFVALVFLYKRGCQNLNTEIWALIIVLVSVFGAIAFFVFGLKRDQIKDYGDEYDD